MADNSSNNKRIVKNTLMLYVRMFLMMAVTLYTSRVVLQQLGIEDFGVYNVVGGAVALLGFLNASMSGATSRFLTYDIGKGDYCHLQLTFSSAMQIHLMIALAVLIFGEIVGIWFVNSCLDIIKMSSLGMTIGIQDIMGEAQLTAATYYKTFETYILAAAFYWILAIVLGVVQKKVEQSIGSAYQK